MDEDKIDAEEIFCDDPAALAALKSFGIKYLYPWQRLVIANIMDASENPDEKTNQIVLLPTGAGKSLCFQIPAMLLNGPTLVIYPLLALMNDQYRRMKDGGLNAVIFKGGQTATEWEENFLQLKKGAKIIIANPEILMDEGLLKRLSEYSISHAAIDEAHCVSEWGDSFRPSYLELGRILKTLNIPVVTAFTATASPEVLERISEVLFDGNAHIVRSESDRPNIHYYVKKVSCKKNAVLSLAATEKRPMIVFCGTRGKAEDMSRELNMAYGKETSRFYHAGLDREEKDKIEKWFFENTNAVLCATCAYGMGVDKKDIHTVVHLEPSETAEAYIQEAGRGGRDGSIANAILLWNADDRKKFAGFTKGSRKAAIREFAETTSCRRQVLLDALGAEQAVCDGCDICDSKKTMPQKSRYSEKTVLQRGINFYKSAKKHFAYSAMPASHIPNDEEIALNLIKFGEKYFTKESFSKFYTELLNRLTLPLTGVKIWNHENAEYILGQLISEGKVRICSWPWKGRLSTLKEKGKIIFLYHRLRHLVQTFAADLQQQVPERQEPELS